MSCRVFIGSSAPLAAPLIVALTPFYMLLRRERC